MSRSFCEAASLSAHRADAAAKLSHYQSPEQRAPPPETHCEIEGRPFYTTPDGKAAAVRELLARPA